MHLSIETFRLNIQLKKNTPPLTTYFTVMEYKFHTTDMFSFILLSTECDPLKKISLCVCELTTATRRMRHIEHMRLQPVVDVWGLYWSLSYFLCCGLCTIVCQVILFTMALSAFFILISLNVPKVYFTFIVYFSVLIWYTTQWWREIHPKLITRTIFIHNSELSKQRRQYHFLTVFDKLMFICKANLSYSTCWRHLNCV